MIITTSNDISLLEADVYWDISGTLPVISITNQSQGPNLAATITWFVATSPSGTYIHEGAQLSPDITGNWSTHNLNDNWPRPFNQIEWSGAPYVLQLYVADSDGNVYSITKSATICRPQGNTQVSKNFYGVASTTLQVKCEQARIFFQDITNHVYRGLDGTRLTSTLTVVFPIDETGTIPDPFIGANFSTALVPISYSSDNYQYMQSSVYEYDFGGGVFVRIRYQSRSKNGAAAVSFPVLCNIDLCPLVCEVTKLVQSIETGSCANAEEANAKLNLINPKLLLAQIGKQEPLCGIDVAALIEEIKVIGGFTCDCCNAATGIIPQTASVIDGYTFEIVSVCGDVSGSVVQNGTNIQFLLQDVKYVFEVDTDSPQDITAFSVVLETEGCQKTYKLRTNGNVLAEELANIILGDGNLINLWNTIFQGNQIFELTVDGGCIFQSTSTCDFTFTLSNIPVNTTFALLSSIKIGANNFNISYLFNLTNLAGLQGYLNGLGYGTFVVTNPSGQTVQIASSANGTDIQGINYKISGTTFPAEMLRDCTGYVSIDANQVVQNIIDYLCNIDDSQIVTSQEYSINYIDTNGDEQTITVTEGSTLSELITSLITANNQNAANIGANVSVSCTTIKNQFGTAAQVPQPITANDFAFITKGGGICAQGSFLEVFNYMLTAGKSNSATSQLFCEFVQQCGAGLVCSPYDYFQVLVTNYDDSCPSIVGLDIALN